MTDALGRRSELAMAQTTGWGVGQVALRLQLGGISRLTSLARAALWFIHVQNVCLSFRIGRN